MKGVFTMKKRIFCLCALLALTASCALAQNTYVFPYEGMRYTQQDGETVLTQTNLGEHEELIASLGTTADAILASYMAAGIVMEVIPDEGGQIAVSFADAGDFADAGSIADLSDARRDAFLAQYADSGLYESCEWTKTDPLCVRMTSSAMYGSMPVYTLRYATLNLGRVCLLTQTVVGRVPSHEDDERMERVLAGIRFLSSVTEPTPSPTPIPTATPEPTAAPTPGVATVIKSEGGMTVEGVPAYTGTAELTITGTVGASEEVTVRVDDRTLGRATARKDGTFSLRVTLPEEGDLTLAVMTETAEQMLSVRYEKPAASLTITEPESDTFTGESVTLKGVTEPDATVYVEGDGFKTNVKAGRTGAFTAKITFASAGTRTFTVTAKADGFTSTSLDVTLTRELSQKEWIAAFRMKVIEPDYDDMAANPQKYAGKQFIERGKVMEFTDYDGSPCALVCTENPGKGVWTEPIWVILDKDAGLQVEDIITFYLVGEGLTLPADGAYYRNGIATAEAPVARAEYYTADK